jgi:hypothetical protein
LSIELTLIPRDLQGHMRNTNTMRTIESRSSSLFPDMQTFWNVGQLMKKAMMVRASNPPCQCCQPFDHEALLMELLAAEHDSKEPDDGALEGSGDDYEA